MSPESGFMPPLLHLQITLEKMAALCQHKLVRPTRSSNPTDPDGRQLATLGLQPRFENGKMN